MGSGSVSPQKPPGRPRTFRDQDSVIITSLKRLVSGSKLASFNQSSRTSDNLTTDTWRLEWALEMRAIKTIELLVPVSSTRCRAYTPGLSTWWSTTALKGELVSRWVSRLDAFSDYPVRT